MFASCFLQKIRIENRKKLKEKAYHCYHYSLRYYLKQRSVSPVSAVICRPKIIVGVHLRTLKILHGYFSLGKTSGPTTKVAGSEVLLQMVLRKVRNRCISQENQVGHEKILYQVYQNFRTKKYILFHQKVPTKLFVAQKINLEDTLIYGKG